MEDEKRPYRTDQEFYAEKKLVFKVLDILKRRYNEYIQNAPLGLYNNADVEEKVFAAVKKEAGPITKDQEHTIEALFDTFAGSMLMFQNSETAFQMMELQIQTGGEQKEKPMKHAQIYIHLEEDLGDGDKFLRTIHNFEFIFREDQEVLDEATKWIEDNCSNEQKLRLHLEVIEYEQ